ncbi:hypothetical protein Heshes_03400 [Alicyclobacillus hesperidum]|uniref:ThuA-like domain-containing protein n=1 Tax=Alicyclobacillus hesperidum TaxID=89784 RepID=A0AA37U1N5_9BACL|nr:ThuA domain-containing protein [Alicyclobacillus hesperidum]GLV12656.1 hypothetical protein Heshes_03400 [Alicyclobacillus hesperidum]
MNKLIYAVFGDYYHPSAPISEAFAAMFEPLAKQGYTYTEIRESELADRLAEQPAAVVIYKEDRVDPTLNPPTRWQDERVADIIVQYVEAGGGWLAWHAGMSCYPVPGPYTSMLRGHFVSHPKVNAPVTYTPASHPITDGIAPFTIVDEHYFVELHSGPTDILVSSTSIDGASTAGWAHSYGSGRVCCITPAHKPEGLAHPGVRQLLTNAMLWVTKQL